MTITNQTRLGTIDTQLMRGRNRTTVIELAKLIQRHLLTIHQAVLIYGGMTHFCCQLLIGDQVARVDVQIMALHINYAARQPVTVSINTGFNQTLIECHRISGSQRDALTGS
ncbi:hypothetical protein VSP9026_03802 [Vibrio spartinae]|uniref:Uncharacterized protein n=1 Tax=Vibrio spartinae TaxID=1918945 RepID=A0A1N6M9K6_9VIBR|nr:hypothetical protein VSP9026_03802 [Vibrio spartinae]